MKNWDAPPSGPNNVVDGQASEAFKVLEEQLSTIHRASAEDADYAQESSNLIKNLILTDVSIKTIALHQKLQREGTALLFESLL